MPKFEKGHKFATGGARPGSGRKPKAYIETKQAARDMAKAYIEASIKPVMHQYFQLAAGRMVDKWHEGKVCGQSFEADAPTTRHFVDKLLPEEKNEKEDKRPLVWNIVLQTGDSAQIEAKPADEPKLITYELGEVDEDPTKEPK